MKNWSNPEMKELNVTNTEGNHICGQNVDGVFVTYASGEVKELTSDCCEDEDAQ